MWYFIPYFKAILHGPPFWDILGTIEHFHNVYASARMPGLVYTRKKHVDLVYAAHLGGLFAGLGLVFLFRKTKPATAWI